MKKRTVSLFAAAALAALLLTGCAEAAAFQGQSRTTAPLTGESTTPEDAVDVSSQSGAAAPIAAPAGDTTAGIAGSADPNSGYITEEAAKTAALNHAGLAEADLQAVRVKLDYDDGRTVYDVEFVRQADTGIEEYDYEIDAVSGEILGYDYDAENYNGTQAVSGSTTGSAVTAEQAKQIALQHAGVTESDTRAMELETDRDNGRTVYEFSWKVGFTEYDYEIDADTGEILSFSQEQDD